MAVVTAWILTSSQAVKAEELLAPTNVVSNSYHSATGDLWSEVNRVGAFSQSTDGVISTSSGDDGWDTYQVSNPSTSDFVGLIYGIQCAFSTIKVYLGMQFGDGGNWASTPSVYILKNNVDTNLTLPENDPTDWQQVSAVLTSGNIFNSTADSNPPAITPIVFDLTSLPVDQRTGYGWAVGGVCGDGAVRFVSITELRAYGDVTQTFAHVTDLASIDSLSDGDYISVDSPMVVTSNSGAFRDGSFGIENSDRTIGTLVFGSAVVTEGDRITFTGKVKVGLGSDKSIELIKITGQQSGEPLGSLGITKLLDFLQ